MSNAEPGSSEPKHHRIGGYEILAKIGEGGMGVVFRARQLSLGRVVALKVLPARLTQDSRFVERFFREAKAIAKLSHPNIVRIYDVHRSQGGIYYYAMEYVDGESLGKFLKREGPLAVAHACQVAVQIARALEHAHAQGFVHRDVKPDNVLLDRAGNAKLADLGLARSIADPEAAQTQVASGGSLTSGAVVGTPYYMSPEQAEGKSVDARSDLYALGATFYHLLAGTPPFVAESAIAVITKHLTEPRPDIRKVRPDVPDGLAQVISRMIQIDPAERYADAKSLLEDLEAWAEEGAVPVGPPQISQALPGFKKPLALGLAAGLLLAAGGVWFVRAEKRAAREKEAQELLDGAETAKREFRGLAGTEPRAAALRRAAASLADLAQRYPETRAATAGKHLREEVDGVLADLYQRIVDESAAAIDEHLWLRPKDPEAFQAFQAFQVIRAETERLEHLARDGEVPEAQRRQAGEKARQVRQIFADRCDGPGKMAAIWENLTRRHSDMEVRSFFESLRDFLPEGSAARNHVEAQLRVSERRKKK